MSDLSNNFNIETINYGQYKLTKEILLTKKCTEEYLKKVIEYMDIRDIYRNQIISKDFIINYILNSDYHSSVEDSYITYDDVIYAQSKLKDRLNEKLKQNKKDKTKTNQ